MDHKTTAAKRGEATLRKAECPRCGYDLHGIIATWTDSCPLEGKCSECGLLFEWESVLVLRKHPWLLEHAPVGPVISSALHTTWMLLRPWRFWREVSMSDRVHAVAALLSAALMTAVTALLLALCVAISDWESLYPGYGPIRERLLDFAGNVMSLAFRFLVLPFPLVILTCSIMGGSFLLIFQTMQRASVRPIHVVRIVFYSIPWTFFAWMASGLIMLWVIEAVTRSAPLHRRYEILTTLVFPALLALPVLVVFFGFAVSRYLKLPHAWLIAFLHAVLSLLLTVVLLHLGFGVLFI